MKAIVRPLASTDVQENLVRLRTLVRPNSPEAQDTEWQSSIWRWLETHPLAHKMKRWVVDAGGEIVGHLAALPQYYRVNGQRIVAHTPADYMVLSRYGFHAITLMRKFFESCENCVTCDTEPAVIRVESHFGAQEVAQLQFFVKLRDVSRLPNSPKPTPTFISWPVNYGLRAVDRIVTGSYKEDDLRVDVLADFDETFNELFDSVAAAVPCVPEKDMMFLRWRYGPSSPQATATVLGVREGAILLGYAVLWVTADGKNGYLLDLMTRPNRHDVARSLLREVVRRLGQLDVASIRYKFTKSITSPRAGDLWRSGFFPRKSNQPTLLVKFANSDIYGSAKDRACWSYSFGDGENTFWVR